jgi:xanthine/CO dehydrogenase XdhC/CoxF family maturation factor
MEELDAIVEACAQGAGIDRDAVLATVVHVKGPAYRCPGARLLILPDGRRIGSVNGRCPERAVQAWWFMESDAPAIRVFDATSDEDAVWEFGLGCNGTVHVLLERVDAPGTAAMLAFLSAQREASAPAVVATVIHKPAIAGVSIGDRVMWDGARGVSGELAGSLLEGAILAHAAGVWLERKSRLMHIDELQVFLEWVGPPQSVVIFGAGHDAIPLVRIGSEMGWRMTVADVRPSYARAERFPGAHRVVVIDPVNVLRDVTIDCDTAVVMMTHDYLLDARLLPYILEMRPQYLGMLGPKKRTERLFAELGSPQPRIVDAPIGLDIGCDTPAAIAVSIAAGIQAALSQRGGGFLMHRSSAVHAPAPEFGALTQTPSVPVEASAHAAFRETRPERSTDLLPSAISRSRRPRWGGPEMR